MSFDRLLFRVAVAAAVAASASCFSDPGDGNDAASPLDSAPINEDASMDGAQWSECTEPTRCCPTPTCTAGQTCGLLWECVILYECLDGGWTAVTNCGPDGGDLFDDADPSDATDSPADVSSDAADE